MDDNGIIASFEKVSVTFRFLGEKKQKMELKAKCFINFTPKTMQIIAYEHLDIVKHKHYAVQIHSGEIPAMSENNFCHIFDIAKELRVPVELLLNVVFDINMVSLCGFERRAAIAPSPFMFQGTTTYFLLQVEAPDRMIGVELKGGLSARSERLLQMDKIIKKYSRKPTGSELEMAQRYVAEKEYHAAALHFVIAAQIYEEIEAFEEAKRYYREGINALFAMNDTKALTQLIDSIGDALIKSELIKEVANKLLQIGNLKTAANLVKKLKEIYRSRQFRDDNKAKYYDELSDKIKGGSISVIN